MPKPKDPGGRGREGHQKPYGLFQSEYDGGLCAGLGAFGSLKGWYAQLICV